ncbi:MAG: endonuclease, partial [Paenibacillus sp.]|nr:endonuclease [Paenibacillus sp.]
MTQLESVQTKSCAHCLQMKPLADFKRRSGKRRGATGRRGVCRACRMERMEEEEVSSAAEVIVEASPAMESPIEQPDESLVVPIKKKRKRRRAKKGKTIVHIAAVAPAAPSVKLAPTPITPQFLKTIRAIGLNPTRGGIIRMRGKTDNGRRWYQEIEP